jgi:hypothetical protein
MAKRSNTPPLAPNALADGSAAGRVRERNVPKGLRAKGEFRNWNAPRLAITTSRTVTSIAGFRRLKRASSGSSGLQPVIAGSMDST